jgi:hypothetical protein
VIFRIPESGAGGALRSVDPRRAVKAALVAGGFSYCGKEFKRKLEQGPVDHELNVRCKVYENGRVAANPETLGRQ